MKHRIVFALFLFVIITLAMLLFFGIFGKRTAIDQSSEFAHLIAESKAASTEEIREFVHQLEDGTWGRTTNKFIVPKSIRIESTSKEVAEYVAIARARVKHYKIPELINVIDDTSASFVEIQGENIVVYFLFYPLPTQGGGFKVVIDIKTKAVVLETRDGS